MNRIAKSFSLMLSFVLLMSSINAQSKNNFEQSYKGFKAFYEQALRRHNIVGSSLFLVHDNQIIAKEFYGAANLEKKQPVDEETIYHWASITKTFTGIAIMQLRD